MSGLVQFQLRCCRIDLLLSDGKRIKLFCPCCSCRFEISKSPVLVTIVTVEDFNSGGASMLVQMSVQANAFQIRAARPVPMSTNSMRLSKSGSSRSRFSEPVFRYMP